MIWDDITVLKPFKRTTDELGNETFRFIRERTIKGRTDAPNDEQISLEDRKVTRKEHMFILPAKKETLPPLKFIEFRGQVYRVTSVETLTPRFTELRAVTYENRAYRR
jgi:hypothetical protein